MDYIMVIILAIFIIFYFVWKVLRSSRQFGLNYPSLSQFLCSSHLGETKKTQEQPHLSEHGGTNQTELKNGDTKSCYSQEDYSQLENEISTPKTMHPNDQNFSKDNTNSTDINQRSDANIFNNSLLSSSSKTDDLVVDKTSQSVVESSDSDDSFQIVNRPTEFEMMSEGNNDRIVTPELQKSTSFFSRVTETLRRRSSLESPKLITVPDTHSTSEMKASLVVDETNKPGNISSIKDRGTIMKEQSELTDINEEEETHSEQTWNDDEPSSKIKSDENIENKEKDEEHDESDDNEERLKKEEEQSRKKRLNWVRDKVLASARSTRKAERKNRNRCEKKQQHQDSDNIFPRIENDESESKTKNGVLDEDDDDNEWDEEGDSDDEIEFDLTTDSQVAEQLKVEGNEEFKQENYPMAISCYTKALLKCPSDGTEALVSVLLCNRGACYLAQKRYESVISDCTDALEFDDKYIKAYLRRFRAHEALEKWHDALSDINKAIELDPSLSSPYYGVQKRIEKLSQEQFEREKAELVDKLKTFGNWALGKVGLSLENFKLEQNAETGAYNIQFVQNTQNCTGQHQQSSSSSQ